MIDSHEPATLVDMIRLQAQARGEAVAFHFEGRETSFADLDEHTSRIANGLAARGIRPDERICYLGKNSD
uniref:AMP-binding protein n=1 Tax=Klebsiella pneumoniae TaxID=573 RepID=UPI0013D8885F